MNIQLDQAAIDSAINEHITKAIAKALSGYDVQTAISQKIADQFASGVIGQAIDEAIKAIHAPELVTVLSAEMMRCVTAGIITTMREHMAELILNMKKVPEYDKEVRSAERAKLMAKFEA